MRTSMQVEGYNSAFLNTCYLMWSIQCAFSHYHGIYVWKCGFSFLFKIMDDSFARPAYIHFILYLPGRGSKASSPTEPHMLNVSSNSTSYSQLSLHPQRCVDPVCLAFCKAVPEGSLGRFLQRIKRKTEETRWEPIFETGWSEGLSQMARHCCLGSQLMLSKAE